MIIWFVILLFVRNEQLNAHGSKNFGETSSIPRSLRQVASSRLYTYLRNSLAISASPMLFPSSSMSQDDSNVVIPKNERLYDTKRGSYLPSHPEKYILRSMRDRSTLVMGEVHYNSFDHLLEFRLLSTLAGFYGPKHIAVGLECFYRQHQNALDNFIFNHGSMSTLKQQTNWQETWGYDLSQYAKIFNYAFKNKIRLIGLNVPLPIVEYVATYGLKALPPQVVTLLPTIDLNVTFHKQRFISAISASGGHDGITDVDSSLFQRLYESQSLWDEYMAESAANFLNSNKNTKLMVIAGSGHVAGRVGIPDRIQKRTGSEPFVVVPYEVPWSDDGLPSIDIPPSTQECDWAWYHPLQEKYLQ